MDVVGIDHGSEMMTTRLPSWGDPILPEVWKISEEEMNEKFPLPGTSISLEDHQQDCCMLKIPVIDFHSGLCSLWNDRGDLASTEMVSSDSEDAGYGLDEQDAIGSEDMLYSEHGSDTDGDEREALCSAEMLSSCDGNTSFDVQSEGDSDDDKSLNSTNHHGTSGLPELRCGKADNGILSSTKVSGFENLVGSTDEQIDMETESHVRDDTSFRGPVEKPPPAEWVIEAEYAGPRNTLRFKLKTTTGAAMLLFQEEIISAVHAILEDELDGLLFEFRPINSESVFVHSSKVIMEIMATIDAEFKKRRVEARDDQCEEKRGHRTLRIPSFGLRRKETGKDKFRGNNRPKRLGFAWRALSGRSKIRPRPLNRVE